MSDIPLSRPDIGDAEVDAVVAVMRSARLSIGPWQNRFEAALAGYVGTTGALAISSGTAALDLCLQALDIGPGDEVITPSFTFVASVNAITRRGARPVFVDIDARTMNLDPADLERCLSGATRAVMAVHLFGRPVDMAPVQKFCEAHDLKLIEDACESLGATWQDRPLGSIGDCGVFGFYPNKIITTGEGGAIVSNDKALLRRCAALRNQGRTEAGFLADEVGHNYRLSELACAMGAVQLRRIDELVDKRARAAAVYEELLRDVPGLELPSIECPHGRLAWFVYVVQLDAPVVARDFLISEMRLRGIECGDYFPPVHTLEYYRQRHPIDETQLPATAAVAMRTLALPFFSTIDEQQQRRVCGALTDIFTTSRWQDQFSSCDPDIASDIGFSHSR